MTSNPRYSMIDSMDIRCSRCGYENSPQFRFCGMCGASLRPADAVADDIHAYVNPARAEENVEPMPVEPLLAELTAAQKSAAQSAAPQSAPVQTFPADNAARSEDAYSSQSRHESSPPEPVHGQRTPIPVSGPSFLGLSESSEHGAEYLLEDEPRSGRKLTTLVLLLLLAAAAGLLWHWQKTGYPWSQTGTAVTPPSNSGSPDTTAALPSEVAPPVATQQKTEKPKTGVGERPIPGDNVEPVPSAQSSKTSTTERSSFENPPSSTTAEPKPIQPAAKPPASNSMRTTPTRIARTPRTPMTPPSVVDPAQDSSYLQGQRFLYGGGGVSPNCARAQQYLTAAANNNNSKAESTLGTMYATGHCVSRDLPLAYRWFARALHADPRNTRLERDVEIMWNQMNPQERRLALKNQ